MKKAFGLFVILLAVLNGSASAGYVVPYLSRLKATGPLRCDIPGFSSFAYSSRPSSYIRFEKCLIDDDLIFTVDGARYSTIVATEDKDGRELFSYGRQIDCRELRIKRIGGWRLFSYKPHSNWFTPSGNFGDPVKFPEWWYVPFYQTSYPGWDVIDPPLNPLQKKICKTWLSKRNSIFD